MIKVKTFGVDLRPMKTMMELSEIDKTVNTFIEENKVKRVISVSDAATTDDTGETIGLVRVLCYEI
jgi:predicted ATP-grasp superfamily ATP-dependent carboligase